MKLQNEFEYVCKEFAAYYEKNKTDWNEYAKDVAKDERVKKLNVRLSWDMARGSKVLRFLTEKYWSNNEINDDHYTTLFIAAYTKVTQ